METAAVHPGNPFTALISAYRRLVPSLILFSLSVFMFLLSSLLSLCGYVCRDPRFGLMTVRSKIFKNDQFGP